MKITEHKKKICKRVISMVLVFVLVLSSFPADLIPEKVKEDMGIIKTVYAATDPDDLAGYLDTYGTGSSWSFTSGDGRLAQYSKCFEDPTFAANHKNDTITLATTGTGAFVFDSDYEPIGTSDSPFEGTLIFTTSSGSFNITAYTPMFDYVSDSVSLRDTSGTNIPIVINRAGDVGDEVSPLFAKHVKGSGLANAADWMITLDSSSAHSYSGVIYEMYNSAKINLTFTDNSNHTPATDDNGNITSGSIIANNQSSTNYGILCGQLHDGSALTATYTATDATAVTFIGTETAWCGGFIGELNNASFELLSTESASSSNLNVTFSKGKNHAGFICGHAEDGIITLPTGYTFQGTVKGTTSSGSYAGGIAGYCKNTVVNYATATGEITLTGCNIADGTSTGGVFGYYECDTYANDILINRKYNLTSCTVAGAGVSGGVVGEYVPKYTDAVTIDLENYTLASTIKLNTGNYAGGLIGKYTANGSVTITDTNTSTAFAVPQGNVAYGGVIGEYVNTAYANTLALSNFTVNGLSSTSSSNVGGIIRQLTGSTYVSVSGVSVTNVTATSATYFGGIVSTLDSNNNGSFIDVTGNFTLSMASSNTYKGGAIAGSFKTGVIRLAGITDISGAQAANGYAQLVYENDETLVYAKGDGSDSDWTLKRNSDTTASDLGQWGEVVRMFDVSGTDKNAEDAGIVSVSNNKVTLASVTDDPAITDEVSFAKVALNIQLNDGSDHGALCFQSGGVDGSTLLSSDMTISGKIDLSGTGLLGLMRDGGNGCYYNVNNKQDDSRMIGSPDYFTGTITGSNAEIKLAVGESYGSVNTKGGKIYLSHNNGHSAQGLVSFANGAAVSGITVSGSMNVERVDNAGDALHMGAVMGFMTNGAQLTNISVNTQMDFTRSHQNGKIYIGGVAGLFDGDSTGKLSIIGGTASASAGSIAPEITLHGSQAAYSEDNYGNRNTYTGGILGLLGGKTTSKYDVEIANIDVSPTITLDNNVSNTDHSYLGGMIGRVRSNTTNERSIKLDTVTMTDASVDTKSKYAGGLLGSHWERTNLTVDDLIITGSTVNHKYSSTGSKQSGLVFKGTGKWDINSLSISSSNFTSADTQPASFGLIVNEAYSNDDGLYINLKNSGYTLTGVTVPTTSTDDNYYVDEIAADTKNNDKNDGDILIGGNGTGIININMNTVVNNVAGTKTKITDISNNADNGTGTYQNRLYSQLGNLVGNQNSRYYYNLDVMMSSSHTKTDGEKFLLWSVNQYAASNISSNFSGAITGITDIKLDGLSYYPIPGGDVTLPTGATVTFGFNVIHDYENTLSSADTWKRFPEDTGAPKSERARNQHYLMQTGLFTTVSSLSASNLTLTGDFGYVANVASGALINDSTSGSVSLSGLTLDGLTPSNAASYLLINYINGTGTATPSLTLSNLRATNYSTGLPVAKSLFGTATGQNMTMTFGDIKLDARDGETISGTGWDATAASAMTDAYGTSRSIFSDAIFFTELWAAKTCNMEYNYAVEKDWNTATGPREVTYGKEITVSQEYQNGEKHYYLVGENDGNFTNPISNSNTEFNFSAGFLPYVGNYTSKGTNITYPVNEIKVNYKAPGLTVGCGTYNDPYIITTAAQLNTVAKAINGTAYPGTICLPNYSFDNHLAISWHDSTINPKGCGNYNISEDDYNKATSNNTNGISGWNKTKVRYYLASAYYKIEGTFTLANDFPGIGVPNNSADNYKGNTVFHGVIVGDSQSKPTITNPTNNPFIVVANGAVVKNINITNTGTITREQSETGSNALYGYNGSTTDAKYYGGVIGEIMGGDNIIDDVTVKYTETTTLSGTCKHLIAEGGMVGCVVNGALIFRGSNSVTGRTVSGGGIYSNQFVGRVINGYAVYESITGRTGSAPDNYNTCTVVGENETKTYTYPIDTIDRSNTNKLDVNWSDSTITVPDAQSLYIMSLITQSIASTAETSNNENYNGYSPSYGYKDYVYGVARLGDYTDVGCGTSAEKPADYSSYAYRDSVNNYYSSKQDLVNAPVPYIIYRYTKAYGSDNVTSKNYPARKMTSDNTKFWDITLEKSNTFASMDSFKAFRGIGCVGINPYSVTEQSKARTAFKVATFDGSNNIIKLHISLPRYERDKDNYFHQQNLSLTQTYSGKDLHSANYGHDVNLWQLHGLGLFDCVIVKNDSSHEYQFKDFKLQGTIEDKVYNSSNDVTTGKNAQTQLFCVGGVYGKRVTGNNSDVNFSNITFDGLSITGAYSCGGLVGIDAVKNAKKMKIDGCNSTENGISIIGGYYGKESNKLRHGIGSFVGMTFWCRPYIDGKTAANDTSDISVSNVSSFYDGDYMSSVGGLIGYSGSGAEIKNINLVAANSNAIIGGEKTTFSAGFIGFTQAMTSDTSSNRNAPNEDDLKDCVYIENCTIQKLPIKAKNGVGGFVAKTGNDNEWHTKYIYISDCAVIGDSVENKSEIKAYGTGTTTQTNYAGGFVGDLRSSVVTCLIQNSYIENYTIEGWHVGGIIGETTYRSANLRNLYVKDCEIIRNNASSGSIGGIVGYSNQNLNGYNLKVDGVIFKKKSSSGYDESPADAGFILGANDNNNRIDKFVAIGAYHSDASKVPTFVVKTNGTNTENFFVFADYNNSSATDITNKTGYASTFNNTNNVDQPNAPFVNTNPHMNVGTGEYLTGDGAGEGVAGTIYADVKTGTSNRKYTIGTTIDPSFSSTEKNDEAVLAKYVTDTGAYNDGAFRISTASAEFGDDFDELELDNFAMLVINDDSAKSDYITPFIKSYIRLVTNAAASNNTDTYNELAFGTNTNNEIKKLYEVVIRPCYYDEEAEKFVLGIAGNQGLQSSSGTYSFDSTKADSASVKKFQFSLIDVQFKDPTDTTYTNIAYHLYVPVYAKKMLAVKFSAVSMSETEYYRSPYVSRIASEIAAGKNTTNRSLLVENTGEWTTTFIRYTYPKSQIDSDAEWNFDKTIQITLDGNFDTLPAGTEMILVDPNANSDRFYRYTVPQNITTNTAFSISLSAFKDVDNENADFTPKDLKDIYASSEASNSDNTELYEDYYISLYVPVVEGKTHGILFSSGTEMSYTGEATAETQKANIESDLWSFVVVGDLFVHNITSFTVAPITREITGVNNTITTDVTATVKLKNPYAQPYLLNSDVVQSFFITLTSHEEDGTVTDVINGTDYQYITNTTTLSYSYNEDLSESTQLDGTITAKRKGENYIQLNTGSIKNVLLNSNASSQYPTVIIHSVASVAFVDINAFPYNPEPADDDHIGTQVSIKSNLAYQSDKLLYSSMKKTVGDPLGTFYYVQTRNSAELNFSAVAEEDAADEIGLKTNNRSLLGVNGKYSTDPPIKGKSIYNANAILNYERATQIVYKISLWKKVTNASGTTSYQQVNDISQYLSNVTLADKEVTLTLDANMTNASKYVYTGNIDHENPDDKDKMFEADFSCNVLTSKKEYANYKIQMEVELIGPSNTYKKSYIIYTYAKFDPSVIDED